MITFGTDCTSESLQRPWYESVIVTNHHQIFTACRIRDRVKIGRWTHVRRE